MWSLRIFPSLPGSRLTIFYRDASSAILATCQLMIEFYLLTFPSFPLREKEHKSYFGKNRRHDFRTSKCAGHLLLYRPDRPLGRRYIVYSRGEWINQVKLSILLVVSWTGKMNNSLPLLFAPEDLVSRDRFGRPVPRQPAHSPHSC